MSVKRNRREERLEPGFRRRSLFLEVNEGDRKGEERLSPTAAAENHIADRQGEESLLMINEANSENFLSQCLHG